jgi:hypothetical protein
MKNQITSRDYKRLSAYLDNQLGIKERTHLESHLKEDPELRKELQELEKTRALLRSLPRKRAPRNYFITAEVPVKQIGILARLRYAPAFGIVSAIATILLVLVVFGDRLLSTSGPVALAPAPAVSNEAFLVQQEVQRNVESTAPPTEVAPMVAMQAPSLASPIPSVAFGKVSESEIATPTTIYLDALLPTSTPEVMMSTLGDQTVTSTISCEGLSVNGAYPTLPDNCPTPTASPSEFQQDILSGSKTISSATPTPSPTTTPTPTATPSPSPSPTSTDTPALIQKIAPESSISVPTLTTPAEQELDVGKSTPTESTPAEVRDTPLNFDFMQYLVLAIELSLAGIAIIAGITAIILRIRAGR